MCGEVWRRWPFCEPHVDEAQGESRLPRMLRGEEWESALEQGATQPWLRRAR